MYLQAAVMLKPDEAVMDSLILYATDKHPGVSDFVAIVIKDFHFELLFDCGSGKFQALLS